MCISNLLWQKKKLSADWLRRRSSCIGKEQYLSLFSGPGFNDMSGELVPLTANLERLTLISEISENFVKNLLYIWMGTHSPRPKGWLIK